MKQMHAHRERGRAGAFAAFAALAVAGVALVFFAVKDFAAARASLRWPTAEAIVLSDRGGGLRYAYTVDGVNYESRRVRFLTASLGASPYEPPHPGAAIDVAVDPDNPRVAVAAPGGAAQLFAIFVAVGGLSVFVGVAGMIRAGTAEAEDEAERLRRLENASL